MTEHRDRLADVQRRIEQFNSERNWGKFHDPKNLAMAIASEAGELLADLRWVESRESDTHVRNPIHRQNIEHEIGDIAIALLTLCRRAGIDPIDAIESKLLQNEQKYPVETSRDKADPPT
jgi:dCTP diphosphatase